MSKSETFCPDCPNRPENRSLKTTRPTRVLFHDDGSVTYDKATRKGCLGEVSKASGQPLELLHERAQRCDAPTETRVHHSRTLAGRLGLSKDTIIECPVTEGLFDTASQTEVGQFFEDFDPTAYALWQTVKEGATQ